LQWIAILLVQMAHAQLEDSVCAMLVGLGVSAVLVS